MKPTSSREQEAREDRLESRIAALERRLSSLEDAEAIKRLQRCYGYYLTHGLIDDLLDLFADRPDTSLLIAKGEYKGKQGVTRFLRSLNNPPNRLFFHQVMMISGIVDVAPGRDHARGRWFGFGACALPDYDGGTQGWMNGVYENEYVREDEVWKINRIRWCSFFFPPDLPLDVALLDHAFASIPDIFPDPHFEADGPPEVTVYASGFVCPTHFVNPVSGRGDSTPA